MHDTNTALTPIYKSSALEDMDNLQVISKLCLLTGPLIEQIEKAVISRIERKKNVFLATEMSA